MGGENGKILTFEKGDVLIIPAGVAHKNLCRETDVICVGAYPDEKQPDMLYGEEGERPGTDQNISNVSIPSADPVYGIEQNGLVHVWKLPEQAY